MIGAMSTGATATVKRYLAAFNERDHDALAELLADDVVEHGIHERKQGVDEVINRLENHFTAFPDYGGETHAIVADDDLVSIRYTARGTHTGEYKGVKPTGLEVSWTGQAMYRVEDDMIAEIWIEEDRLGLLEQLELIDSTEPAHLRL